MKHSIKYTRCITFILCAALFMSTSFFIPDYSYGETIENGEESALESKTTLPEEGSEYNGFIVSIKDEEIDDVSSSDQAEDFQSTVTDKYYLVTTTDEALVLASASSIAYVEPNYKLYPLSTAYPPNDEHYKLTNTINTGGPQKAYENMGIHHLWKKGLHGDGVRVAVLDTGINAHNDMDVPGEILYSNLSSKVVKTKIDTDADGHGTQVTSLIKAKYNNQIGIAGVASDADIVSIRVFQKDPAGNFSGYTFQTLTAYTYLAQSGNVPDIINLSLGTGYYERSAAQALNALEKKGVIIIAANGNNGLAGDSSIGIARNGISYPAGYSSVIGVCATDANGRIANFSTKNKTAIVSAWGENITTLNSKNAFGVTITNGTSFSSPIVAGIAACLKEDNPKMNKALFLALIEATATDKGAAGYDTSYGYGLINAETMLNSMNNKITYYTNGGTWNSGNYMTSYSFSTSKITLPTNLTSQNGHFKGWYKDSALTDGPYTFIPAKTFGDLKFYAKWGTTSKVSYKTNNGKSIRANEFEIGAPYTMLPALTKTGYTFKGWYLDSGFKTPVTESTNVQALDHTLYAKWAANPHKITLYANGGKALSKPVRTYSYGTKLKGLPTPSRTGYKFTGWYKAKKGGSKVGSSTVVKSNMKLYAHWTAKKYTVKFNANKGEKIKPKSKKVTFNKKMGKLPKAKRSGHTFKGWYTKKTGGRKVTSSTKVKSTKSITLYAQWKKK